MHEANQTSADVPNGPPTPTDGLVPLADLIAVILARLAAQRMAGSIPEMDML